MVLPPRMDIVVIEEIKHGGKNLLKDTLRPSHIILERVVDKDDTV